MPTEADERGRQLLYSAIAILLTLACLTPFFFSSLFAKRAGGAYDEFFKIVLPLGPFCIAALCYRIKVDCNRRQKVALFILLATLSSALVYIHYIYIDTTSSYFGVRSNLFWQMDTQRDVMVLSPAAIPHTFRFLPNSMVRILEYLTGDFVYARTLYWLTVMFLLLFAIYYYGRLHAGHTKALMTVLIYACLFPITIRYYAGQLTDPLSHLSFVLALIFLELSLFAYFALAILIGILAKESILLMAVFFLFFRRKEKHYLPKTFFLLAAGAAVTLGIRLWVVPAAGSPLNDYFVLGNLKDTWIPYLAENFRDYPKWGLQTVFTVGIFVPFLILAWKSAPRNVRNPAVFLLVTLLATNATFSWMVETRNLIPAVIPLALITSDYLLGDDRGPLESKR